MLNIQLFGYFQLCADGQPITAIGQRGQALLAYLLLQRQQAQPRKQLAMLLWPETHDHQALANLRTELTRLRRAWPACDHYLAAEDGLLQWRPTAAFTVDVQAFAEAWQRAEGAERIGDAASALNHWQVAINHYTGPLLANNYEDWVLTARQQLHDQLIDALTNLIALLQQRGDYALAIRYTKQLLSVDPLHERAYRQLMELHALHGDHASIKQVYEACTAILRRELAVPPSPRTQQCYRTLLRATP